jgi:hypothetical protein
MFGAASFLCLCVFFARFEGCSFGSVGDFLYLCLPKNLFIMAHTDNRYPTLRETKFVDLMQRRVFNVLIIANPYDAFMLEDDGRVDEKIFDEYAKLGLRYPPRFFRAASREEATE